MFFFLRIEAKHDWTTTKIGEEDRRIRRRNEKNIRGWEKTLIIEARWYEYKEDSLAGERR